MFGIKLLCSKPDGPYLWMKPSRLWCFFAALLILLLASCKADHGQNARSEIPQPPATIFLIRHAEKLSNGEMDLSAAGSERAKLLVQAFSSNGNRPDLPTPQVLFAAHVSAHSNRSLQTLLPLATSLHLPIDDSFKDEDFEDLAAALLSGKYAGKVVLVAWHRGEIPQLATALGATAPYARWPAEQYDRIWRIDYVDGKASLRDLPYALMPGDSN
jgi:hypothetical protein